jgi:hypothetical protein
LARLQGGVVDFGYPEKGVKNGIAERGEIVWENSKQSMALLTVQKKRIPAK